MLPPVLPLYRTRRKQHMAFALHSNSLDCEMTSPNCSRGFRAAAGGMVASLPDRRTDRRAGGAVDARQRRRSAKGWR